jgi:hypothetical protein
MSNFLSGRQPELKVGIVSFSENKTPLEVVGSVSVSGIVSASGGFNLGISSAGTQITSGPITSLNFIGAGNTFVINGTTVDISIAGGGGGASVSISTIAPLNPGEGDLWYSSILGRTYIYYEDDDSSQWVDASPFNIPEPHSTPGKTSATFTATEGQTVFSYSYSAGYIDVFLNGIRLSGTEFVANNGTSITLIEGASAGDVLDVVEYTMGIGDTGPQGSQGLGGPLEGVVEITSNQILYPLIVTGIGTTIPYITTTNDYFEFNPSSGTLTTNQLNIVGIATASSFSGSGTSLTNLNASNISSGTVAAARLGFGTADSGTFLRGDQTWQSISSGSGGITINDNNSTNSSFYLTFTSATSGTITEETVSSTKLTFNPSTGTLTATNINTTSDINLKENIRPIENPLDKILQVNGVEFDWRDTQQASMGVIAQEIEKVFPSIVKTIKNKSVNYNGLIALLIEAVKEQQEQINILKEKIDNLENQD